MFFISTCGFRNEGAKGTRYRAPLSCQKALELNENLNAQHPDCGSPVVKESEHGRHVMSPSPVPLKTRRVGQRLTVNLLRSETSSRLCGS
ncbi:hypothetical protein TNCV_2342141 [Trichonephila clavipes]|nr:hypothetical protein TNCV_2342141 [Trichonephila clavipes]